MTQGNGHLRETALITGASGGIGLELAKQFAAGGHDLVLVARSEEKLAALAAEVAKQHSVKTTVIALDLARPDASRVLVEKLEAAKLEIDTLVNNAGYGLWGAFSETAMTTELEMIQLNVVTLTELTKRLLPGMIARKRGRVLNLASTAAFQPGPLMAVYYATKAYVLSFSEALANELDGTGVTVTALCPGPTESGFQAVAKLEGSKLIAGRKLPTSKWVAEVGYKATLRGQRVVIPGLMNWTLAQSIRFLPRTMVTSFVRMVQEKRAP